MKLRTLGDSGLRVPPLCFGCNVLGWTVDEPTAFALLDACMDAGVNFLDTADVYSAWAPGNSGGESESVIGNWMKKRGNRAKVIVATKVGMKMAPDRRGLSKKYILSAVEDSLRRLQTDYIDLYQSHEDDPETPPEETLGAFDELVRTGKVRLIGASNFSAERLAVAIGISREHGFPVYQSLQPRYNLYHRDEFEAELEALCLKEKIGVITYSSLASGFLTGKYRSKADLGKSPRGARAEEKFNERGYRILEALDRIASEYDSTPTTVALAWLMARPSVTAPIVSATSLVQLTALIESMKLDLNSDNVRSLDLASEWKQGRPLLEG